MSREDELKRLITNHNRRLQILQERKALLGVTADPSLLLEIEDIEAELDRLQSELKKTSVSTGSLSVTLDDATLQSELSVTDSVKAYARGKLQNPYTFGVPVSSGEFYGRETELRLIFETLDNVPYGQKQDMVILGPRRIGKSSLLYHLVDLLANSQDFVPVYVDIQNIKPRKPRQLFFEILEKIQEGYQRKSSSFVLPLDTTRQPAPHIREAQRDYSPTALPLPPFKTLTSTNIPPDMAFHTFKKDLSSLSQIIVNNRLPRPVVMFDEVELLLEFGGQDMLDWFRSLIQSSHYIVFVVAGSERLYSLTQDYGSPFYNIFKIIELHPLTFEAAQALVEEPARQIGLEISATEINKIVSYAGNSPYFIQGICHYLVERLNQEGRHQVHSEDTNQVLIQSLGYFSGHFSYIWGGLSQVEQALLYALAERKSPQTAEALIARLPQFEDVLRSRREQKETFDRLVQQQILRVDTGHFQFVVLLFVDWILANVDEYILTPPLDVYTPGQVYALPAVRRLLNQVLDDPSLDSFTLDYFPTVYDRYSRGMRKYEKINHLLDYTRRDPEQFSKLFSLLKELYPTQYQTFAKDLHISK